VYVGAAAFWHLLLGFFACGELWSAGCGWWFLKEVQKKRLQRDVVKKPFLKRSDLEAKKKSKNRRRSSSSSDTERREKGKESGWVCLLKWVFVSGF
jgi:hypothetical protein